MKLLGKLRNRLKNKKGFTLVELIVVIVIIAILAALIVPSVMKYIDKAKDQQVIADARSVYIATQTVATEAYAKGTPVEASPAVGKTSGAEAAGNSAWGKKIYALGTTKAQSYTTAISVGTDYQVTAFTFIDTGLGKTVTYNVADGTWGDVTKTAP